MKTAATEALSFPVTPPMRSEIELLLRELERFVAATDLKVEWQEPSLERQEAFRKVLERFGKRQRHPRE